MATTYADVRAIDTAILAVLKADPILSALMPDGVHWEIGPPGLIRFVIVSLSDFASELLFGDTANERTEYQVKAIARTTDGDAALDAGARIHDLLEQQPLTLTGTGFELMLLRRVRRVRHTETSNGVTWIHVGGYYQSLVTSGAMGA